MRNSSVTRIKDASEVSFTRDMKVLDNGGTDTRAAWGRMMRTSVCGLDMPMVWPASHWPLGTDRMAARMISAA
ncbi:hypothetical protein D3C86_2205940 [compost metagenome]